VTRAPLKSTKVEKLHDFIPQKPDPTGSQNETESYHGHGPHSFKNKMHHTGSSLIIPQRKPSCVYLYIPIFVFSHEGPDFDRDHIFVAYGACDGDGFLTAEAVVATP
jgi:hypothetical protein